MEIAVGSRYQRRTDSLLVAGSKKVEVTKLGRAGGPEQRLETAREGVGVAGPARGDVVPVDDDEGGAGVGRRFATGQRAAGRARSSRRIPQRARTSSST